MLKTRFIYADDTTFELDLPAMLPNKSLMTTGGDIDGDSGMRAAYVIRRDELMTIVLRFREVQWVALVACLDRLMDSGEVFGFVPNTDDGHGWNTTLESPAPGTTFFPTPDGSVPDVLTLPIIIRAENETFDEYDIFPLITALRTMDFGRGPSAGKALDTLYHGVTATQEDLTVTWPNYVVPSNSAGWQGVVGTGGDSGNPQSMVFDKPVKKVSVYWEEMNFYDGYMAAYDIDGVEIGRYTHSFANVSANGPTSMIEFPDNRIYKVTMQPNADWVTYSHVVIDRFVTISGGP